MHILDQLLCVAGKETSIDLSSFNCSFVVHKKGVHVWGMRTSTCAHVHVRVYVRHLVEYRPQMSSSYCSTYTKLDNTDSLKKIKIDVKHIMIY